MEEEREEEEEVWWQGPLTGDSRGRHCGKLEASLAVDCRLTLVKC